MKKYLLNKMSGKELRELINNEVITVEELSIAALEKVFDYEINMLCLGKGDMELICKCSELIDAANGGSISSEDEFRAIINKARAEYVTIVPDKPIRKPFVFKRALIIAAAVIVVAASSMMIAGAFGFDILEYIRNVISEPAGTVIDANNITFHNAGETKEYASIEELIESENLDIMYPTKFPDGIEIVGIKLDKSILGNDMIQIYTNDVNVGINIELSATNQSSSNSNTYECNNLTYYIDEAEIFCASCYHNNDFYYITANTEENLIYIIENIKE